MSNSFVNAVKNQEARTANGMKARKSTASANVDLFFKIGASRGKNIIPQFTAAYVENPEYALRIALWARDAREGAGERQLFRDLLAKAPANVQRTLVTFGPKLGRWDDMLAVTDPEVRADAINYIKAALDAGNGLAAKWMPRKGPLAAELRKAFGWTPKFYRKRLVELTKVVETQMCAKDWDNINFNHVPSLAAARYKKAFFRNTPKFKEYVDALVKGEKGVKVNAGAVYPYDVLKGFVSPYSYNMNYNKTELGHVIAQWEALPNYVGDANILPLVDVSGSMVTPAGGYNSKSGTTCLDVAVSLGLYLADKNKGKFKDTFLTFSERPELLHLKGNIVEKAAQMTTSKWAMNTNIEAAFRKILDVAKNGNVPQEEMPNILLILSDMQFDQSTGDYSASGTLESLYKAAGYNVPQVVYWNLNAADNVPVEFSKGGTALVSGFSPAIMKSVLSADLDKFSPEGIMLQTIMNPRYDPKDAVTA